MLKTECWTHFAHSIVTLLILRSSLEFSAEGVFLIFDLLYNYTIFHLLPITVAILGDKAEKNKKKSEILFLLSCEKKRNTNILIFYRSHMEYVEAEISHYWLRWTFSNFSQKSGCCHAGFLWESFCQLTS